MLTEVKNNYKSILKYFDFDEFISSSSYKKQKLIEMAKSGAKRPTNKTKEGRCLTRYTVKSSNIYCPEFDKTIRKSRPDWFESTSQIMKQKLIEMANNRESRPHSRLTKEGRALRSYTNKSQSTYCPNFDKTIRKLRPDWLESTSQIMKQKLIEIAKNKEDRPKQNTKEGRALRSYTNKSSDCYCEKFDKIIRSLPIFWFASKSYFVKQKLIQMAKNKEDRPKQNTKEGRALNNYISKSSSAYCSNFDKTIRKLRPDWFMKSSDKKKQLLIDMAKSGAKRPNSKTTKEGCALSSYTNKSSDLYCEKFDKTIRKLRPDWFESTSQIMKQKLINMAKRGEPRPNCLKTKEGRALTKYTNKSQSTYCPNFDKTIRKLRPDWFIKKRTLVK
jgi:hypothetical protein